MIYWDISQSYHFSSDCFHINVLLKMMETQKKVFFKYLLIYIFSLILVLFKNSSRNFREDILRLAFVFIAFVATSGSVAGSVAGSGSDAGSLAGSGLSSRVEILSKSFIGNNLLLKLLRTFSFAINDNPKLFEKVFYSNAFIALSKFFNLLAYYFPYYHYLLLINVLLVYIVNIY